MSSSPKIPMSILAVHEHLTEHRLDRPPPAGPARPRRARPLRPRWAWASYSVRARRAHARIVVRFTPFSEACVWRCVHELERGGNLLRELQL
jgi:hypothetical protein